MSDRAEPCTSGRSREPTLLTGRVYPALGMWPALMVRRLTEADRRAAELLQLGLRRCRHGAGVEKGDLGPDPVRCGL